MDSHTHTRTCIQYTEQWGPTCRLTNSWKAWSMAECLWSSRDLNFIFSTSLNVSKTTAKSYKKGDRNDNETSLQSDQVHAERMTGRFLKASQYQIHDEIELYGEVNDEEHTGPAVLGVCWHHHIRETTKKELTWDKKMTHDALKAELQPAECKPINIKDVTSHTVQFCLLKSIFSKINPIFQRVLEWINRNWKLGAASSIAKLT